MSLGRKPPRAADARHIPDRVEDCPKIVLALRTVLPAKQKIRQHKRLLLIRHIARITNLTPETHPSMLTKETPAKTLNRFKVHNRL